LNIFKRRGGVTTRPLLIDVAAMLENRVEPDPPSAAQIRSMVRSTARGRSFSPRFNRQYPCGMPPARIWNRALVRADGLARMPGPDPRGQPRRFHACSHNACSAD
jgi:hypothetical protein